MRRFHFALLTLISLVAQPLLAKTYYVGSCKTTPYSTIGAAVAAVPAGSTIEICPGTNAEQVTISQPLTLKGIVINNSSQAVIAVPSGGLATTSTLDLGTVAAQVEVTTGPVNITNITVDGTAGTTNCPSVDYIGVFYSSGSSGTVNEVETRNQNCSTASGPAFGIGIAAENGAGAVQSVTIENSDIHDNSGYGIYASSPDQTPPTLTTSIKSNYVTGFDTSICLFVPGSVTANTVVGGNVYGIFPNFESITVTGNTVISAWIGISVAWDDTVSDNTVTNAAYGINTYGTGTVTSNHISNSSLYGIDLMNGGATIENNIITKSSSAGIEFNCNSGTVSGNTINGAPTGFDEFPSASTGTNLFYNVATASTGCQ